MNFIKRTSIKYFVAIAAILIVGIIGYVVYDISQNDSNTIGKSENGYRVDREPINNRFPKLGDFEKCYWNAATIGQNSRVSVPGPSSYWMKGFVILNNKELEAFKTQYKWTQVEGSWKPSLDTSVLKIQSFKWSYSEDFNNFVKSSSYVGKFYLDLEQGIVYFDVEK